MSNKILLNLAWRDTKELNRNGYNITKKAMKDYFSQERDLDLYETYCDDNKGDNHIGKIVNIDIENTTVEIETELVKEVFDGFCVGLLFIVDKNDENVYDTIKDIPYAVVIPTEINAYTDEENLNIVELDCPWKEDCYVTDMFIPQEVYEEGLKDYLCSCSIEKSMGLISPSRYLDATSTNTIGGITGGTYDEESKKFTVSCELLKTLDIEFIKKYITIGLDYMAYGHKSQGAYIVDKIDISGVHLSFKGLNIFNYKLLNKGE